MRYCRRTGNNTKDSHVQEEHKRGKSESKVGDGTEEETGGQVAIDIAGAEEG